ncbi:hypothetical protein [Jiella sp. M17.18]|uniref:hypothetical protein n=1 Tax=Jiella sp. M17.18 TaxID=3234247 RepID=UPI0034DEAA81
MKSGDVLPLLGKIQDVQTMMRDFGCAARPANSRGQWLPKGRSLFPRKREIRLKRPLIGFGVSDKILLKLFVLSTISETSRQNFTLISCRLCCEYRREFPFDNQVMMQAAERPLVGLQSRPAA